MTRARFWGKMLLAGTALVGGSATYFIYSQKVPTIQTSGAGVSPPLLLPRREEQIARLQNVKFDMLVIGGGSSGAGIALDAQRRGLQVALVEKSDYASGTSSASTKMLHGGVRYLEAAVFNADLGQLNLVREALHERVVMMAQAPHLTSKVAIITPLYTWTDVPMFWTGLKFYDWFSGRARVGGSKFLSPSSAAARFPLLKPDGLKGAVVYHDGQFDDARFNVALVLTAQREGVAALNHCEVVALSHHGGQLNGARVRDTQTGNEFQISAKIVVNATGPGVDKIRQMDATDVKPILAASAGAHIILDRSFSEKETGLLIPHTDDGRVLFLLPWQGSTLVGTTDRKVSPTSPTAAYPIAEDVDYLIEHLNRYLSVPVSRSDVKATFCGIRPLKQVVDEKDTSKMSREHSVLVSFSGLVSIVGGKWSTYRALSEDVVTTAIKERGAHKKSDLRPSDTANVKFVGAHEFNNAHYLRLAAQHSLPIDVAAHLNLSYGDQGEHVAALASQSGLSTRLAPNHPFVEAEVLWAVRQEQACTLTDVLCRRMRLGYLDRAATLHAAPRAAEMLAEELNWTPERKAQELAQLSAFLFDGAAL